MGLSLCKSTEFSSPTGIAFPKEWSAVPGKKQSWILGLVLLRLFKEVSVDIVVNLINDIKLKSDGADIRLLSTYKSGLHFIFSNSNSIQGLLII